MASELERWFDRRSYSTTDFDVRDLAARKAESGVTVSVVLPARNEAPTVRGVVDAVASLAGSLVDEVVVLDGSSTDGTPALAAEGGARVHDDSDVLADFGPAQGKGDAMWRSLAVTSGDIVAFVDTDIRNPDPKFVWGPLGPLLTDPDIQLCKAHYARPIELDKVLHPVGGGRVTELMARPLLNLLFPPLAGIVQPLSGEFAARRSLFESIPFFTGYGVEIGMLIDTAAQAGIDAIAQVDLQQRVHRNQSIDALSRMAFGLLQVAMRRYPGTAGRDGELPVSYTQFVRDATGVRPETREVAIVERPAMASLDGGAWPQTGAVRSQRTP